MSSTASRLLAALLGLGAAVVLAELAVRVLALPGARAPRPMAVDRELLLHVLDPELGYRLRPNSTARFQGPLVTTNELGCRGAPLPPDLDPSTLAVSLGDSIAFGAGVDQEDVFTAQLQRQLRSEGHDASVLNCGVSGYNLEQMMGAFDARLAKLRPAVVVVNLFEDDLEPPYRIQDRSLASRLRGRSALFRTLELSPLWPVAGNRDLPAWAHSPEDYRGTLTAEFDGWASRLQAKGTALVVLLHPFLQDAEGPAAEPSVQLVELARARGVEPIWMRTAYAAAVGRDLSPLSIAPEFHDPHPNRQGHRLIAEALAGELRARGLLGLGTRPEP